ncbi:hypothetical protein ACFX2C_004168 [Malus domestica]
MFQNRRAKSRFYLPRLSDPPTRLLPLSIFLTSLSLSTSSLSLSLHISNLQNPKPCSSATIITQTNPISPPPRVPLLSSGPMSSSPPPDPSPSAERGAAVTPAADAASRRRATSATSLPTPPPMTRSSMRRPPLLSRTSAPLRRHVSRPTPTSAERYRSMTMWIVLEAAVLTLRTLKSSETPGTI